MKNISNKVLLEEERFMLGDSSNGLEIIIYLQINGFTKDTSEEGAKKRTLKYNLKDGGEVPIDYNKYKDIMQVIISGNVPKDITDGLKKIGERSREVLNKKKYGVAGVF